MKYYTRPKYYTRNNRLYTYDRGFYHILPNRKDKLCGSRYGFTPVVDELHITLIDDILNLKSEMTIYYDGNYIYVYSAEYDMCTADDDILIVFKNYNDKHRDLRVSYFEYTNFADYIK